MHLHRSRVQTERFDLDAHNLFLLQLLKHAIQHAVLRPAVHAHVDRMPRPKALGKPSPLASLFRHIQNGVENLQVGQTYVAPLHRQTLADSLVLLFRNLHLLILHENVAVV